MKPVFVTAARIALALFGSSNAPSGAMPFGVFEFRKPMTDA